MNKQKEPSMIWDKHVELVEARKYYGKHATGSVILINGQPEFHMKTREARRLYNHYRSPGPTAQARALFFWKNTWQESFFKALETYLRVNNGKVTTRTASNLAETYFIEGYVTGENKIRAYYQAALDKILRSSSPNLREQLKKFRETF
jgi:hypothetical protein